MKFIFPVILIGALFLVICLCRSPHGYTENYGPKIIPCSPNNTCPKGMYCRIDQSGLGYNTCWNNSPIMPPIRKCSPRNPCPKGMYCHVDTAGIDPNVCMYNNPILPPTGI